MNTCDECKKDVNPGQLKCDDCEAYKLKCIEIISGTKRCNYYKVNDTDYCNRHMFLNDYTEQQKATRKPCGDCKVSKDLEGMSKCQECRDKKKNRNAKNRLALESDLKNLCKHTGCKSKCKENGYCGKHQRIAEKIKVEEDGKRKMCSEYTRGCKATLPTNSEYSKCPSCRDKAKYQKAISVPKSTEILPAVQQRKYVMGKASSSTIQSLESFNNFANMFEKPLVVPSGKTSNDNSTNLVNDNSTNLVNDNSTNLVNDKSDKSSNSKSDKLVHDKPSNDKSDKPSNSKSDKLVNIKPSNDKSDKLVHDNLSNDKSDKLVQDIPLSEPLVIIEQPSSINIKPKPDIRVRRQPLKPKKTREELQERSRKYKETQRLKQKAALGEDGYKEREALKMAEYRAKKKA
jgi:hypothetical protein